MSKRHNFEDRAVLSHYRVTQDGAISITSEKSKFGRHALRWDWENSSALSVTGLKPMTLAESGLKYMDTFPASPSFFTWIYNEAKSDQALRFEFGVEGSEIGFAFPLNFEGWSLLKMPYFSMEASNTGATDSVPTKGQAIDFETFRIISPSGTGRVFLDNLALACYEDNRFLKAHQRKQNEEKVAFELMQQLPASPLFNESNIKQITRLESEYIRQYCPGQKRGRDGLENALIKLDEQFHETFRIERQADGSVRGIALIAEGRAFYYESCWGLKNGTDFAGLNAFGRFFLKLAETYSNRKDVLTAEERGRLEERIVDSLTYLFDQGWRGKSPLFVGTVSYRTRELSKGMFLCREFLERQDPALLSRVRDSLCWQQKAYSMFFPEKERPSNFDFFRLHMSNIPACIFSFTDAGKKDALLRRYSEFLSTAIDSQDKRENPRHDQWGFRMDGTTFHHWGHYPAYANASFQTIPPLIKLLNESDYRVSEEALANFRKALLSVRLYTQNQETGFGMAGRHPLTASYDLKAAYRTLSSLTGRPLDREMASAYMRLWGYPEESSSFQDAGIEAEELSGFWTFPYGGFAIHRRDGWMMTFKGYNRFTWGSETYIVENRYARYLSAGTAQVMYGEGAQASGYQNDGWDWNRAPGATIVPLPWEELEFKDEIAMLKSLETFMGGVHRENRDGVFAMKVDESTAFNFDPSCKKLDVVAPVKALKSYFCMGDRVICLGSGISAQSGDAPVETVLFQNQLQKKDDALWVDQTQEIKAFPYERSFAGHKPLRILDPYGTGYIVYSGGELTVKKAHQTAPKYDYSYRYNERTKKVKGSPYAQGDFASAWIHHGKSPDNQAYEYVVIPQTSAEELSRRSGQETKGYRVLRQDHVAHIVEDEKSATTGYAIFGAGTALNTGLIDRVSHECLVMLQEKDGQLILSVAVPDLNAMDFKHKSYIRGHSKPYGEGYQEPGPSRDVELLITLNNAFKLIRTDAAFGHSVKADTAGTSIILNCRHGKTTHFYLEK
ncbi:chondroitinase family polysaccharide lyase [Pontiella desulfatans]|uniref:chondroitinase family polysaccharide lyase n=1 Tax=Pontiella desulfatans TaxID=2750659 RepID=UPI0014440120|nr:chondroitinase family polysaccharide lyase [Pontiella desulfatans]